MAKMTKGEREELMKLARERAKLGKVMAEQRKAELLAEAEEKLAAEYDVDDEAWRDLTAAAHAAVRKADQEIARRCGELGIPKLFRPGLSLGWHRRGENAAKLRREEWRKVLTTRIDALLAKAVSQIELAKVELLTVLASDALESEAAQAFLAAMPSPAMLMPSLDRNELKLLAAEADAAAEKRTSLYN